MPLTLMAVHAHPDDEATSTGGLLARAAAEGVRTILVTCTDGSCGDGPNGVKPGEAGHDPAAVVAMRRPELEASCAILGIDHLEWLGFVDSGMMGWDNNDRPGSFWSTPVEDAAARLAELMDRYQPDVVVTYDPNGFYGHPDHIQAHRVTMAAVEQRTDVKKVYWTTVPHSMMAEFGARLAELGVDFEPPTSDEIPQLGAPDDEVTTWVDVLAYAGKKYDALAAHASQGENIFFLQMGRETFSELMGIETFIRVHDTTSAAVPEDDIFAGLR